MLINDKIGIKSYQDNVFLQNSQCERPFKDLLKGNLSLRTLKKDPKAAPVMKRKI